MLCDNGIRKSTTFNPFDKIYICFFAVIHGKYKLYGDLSGQTACLKGRFLCPSAIRMAQRVEDEENHTSELSQRFFVLPSLDL